MMETGAAAGEIPVLAMVGIAIMFIGGIIGLVGMIMLIVRIFNKEDGSKGAIAIILAFFCQIALYIWGWVKVREWDAKRAMMIWTAGIVVSLIGWAIAMAGGLAAGGMPGMMDEGTYDFDGAMPEMPDTP